MGRAYCLVSGERGGANEHLRAIVGFDLRLRDPDFLEDRVVMFALEGRRSGFVEDVFGEMPRVARQSVRTAKPVRHLPNGSPILRPLGLRQVLKGTRDTNRDLGLIQLGIEGFKIGKRVDPRLYNCVQGVVVREARLRSWLS
jgi:hypothetical protein